MVRIDFFIFGYRKIIIPSDFSAEIAGMLLRAKIPSVIRGDGVLLVREKDYRTAYELLREKSGVSFSECLGIYGAFLRIKHKKALAAASIISLVTTILFSLLIWDVRVEGNEKIPDHSIVSSLEESGFKVGSFFGFLNLSDIENEFLKHNPSVSWININRRGTVAYVTVKESENEGREEITDKTGYANIVASADCVIEEITVTKGYAVCKVGDSVKKGDLLISGVIPSEFGSQYCYAEGTVVGRIKDEIVAECGRNYTKKEPNGEKTVLLDVKIFDFIINIFKKYGNIQEECDIIRDVKTYSLFGKSKLPFEVYTESITEYREKECSYTDSEIIFAAGRMLERKLNDSLRGCDLLRLRTEGEFTDGGYLMRCEAVYLTEVGEELSFAVE